MTSLPPPPPSAPPGPPARRGPGPAALVLGAAVALALLVALAARGASPWGPARRGEADVGELVVTVLVAVVATLALGAAIVALLHRLVLSQRPGAAGLRPTLVRSLPLLAVAAAAVALLAISWTPLEPTPEDLARQDPSGPSGPSGPDRDPFETPTTDGRADPRVERTWREAEGLERQGRVVAQDVDGDAELEIGVDLDGDGSIDRILLDGDGSSRDGTRFAEGGSLFVRCAVDRDCEAAVDLDGDGELDQLVELDPSFRSLGPVDGTLLSQRYGPIADLLVDGESDEPVLGDSTTDTTPDERDQADADDPADEDRDDDGDSPIAGAIGKVLLLLLGLVVVGGLIALLVAALRNGLGGLGARFRRGSGGPARSDDPEPELEAAREQMAASVGDSIDAMVADPDPRTAIIGAYARLLEGLAASDVARLPHEAPVEHLERALTRLSVRPEPLRHLIALFEVARFSTHPLGEGDRAEALAALRAAAQDLAAARPPLVDVAAGPGS